MFRGNKIPKIIQFWFQKSDLTQMPLKTMSQKWWFCPEEINQKIRQQYYDDILAARQGKLQQWRKQKDGILAYIILNDQFIRNISKGKAQSFANDYLAVSATHQLLKNRQLYNKYEILEKCFILMPLQHSQNMENQETMIKQMDLVYKETEERKLNVFQYVKMCKDYAVKHYEIVKQFGRYPYRNAVLGRQSTPEEIQWLKNGQNFGFK